MTMNSSKRFLCKHGAEAFWFVIFVSSHLLALAKDSKEGLPESKKLDIPKKSEAAVKAQNNRRFMIVERIQKSYWSCQTLLAGPIGVCKPLSKCCHPATMPHPCYRDGKQLYACCIEEAPELGRMLETRETIRSSTKDQSEEEELVNGELSNSLDFPGCGIRPLSTENKFESVDKNKLGWPWMVAISTRLPTGLRRLICGGSLITKRHARCFTNTSSRLPLSDYVVQIGAHFNFNDHDKSNLKKMKMVAGKEYKIRRFIVHDQYQENYHYHHIAMLLLAKEVKLTDHAMPICLPSGPLEFPDDGDISAKAIGWGLNQEDAEIPKTLHQLDIHIVPVKSCRPLVPEYSTLNSSITDMVCVRGLEAVKDVCPSEPGSPLVLTRKDQRWIMVGILSFGMDEACKDESKTGVYTRVVSFISWIIKHIRNQH